MANRFAKAPTDGLQPGDWKADPDDNTKKLVWNGTSFVSKHFRFNAGGRELGMNTTRKKNIYALIPEGYDGVHYYVDRSDGDNIVGILGGNPEHQAKLKDKRKAEVMTRVQKFGAPSANWSTAVLKYPFEGVIGEQSDYVLFEFKRYIPPFRQKRMLEYDALTGTKFKNQLKKQLNDSKSKKLASSYDYNQAADYKPAGDEFPSVIMYMPEDISTGFRSNWGGKAFSTIGAGILAAAGQAGIGDKIGSGFDAMGKAAERALGLTAVASLQKVTKMAGGDTLSNDDVFGSISGAILNPNTELLYQSVDQRNFMLKFKLVPRKSEESLEINQIIKVFKACTLPLRNPGMVMGQNDPLKSINNGVVDGFIGVPNLCKVSFMRGNEEHKVLPRYKMLAITEVDVNYTPDGVYATYDDYQPVAIEIQINFQETKINFAEEVIEDYIR